MPNNLTIGQVAAALAVDTETVRQRAKRLRAAGKRCGVNAGGWWRYTKRDLERLRAAGKAVRE